MWLLQVVYKRLSKTCVSSNTISEKGGTVSPERFSETQFHDFKEALINAPFLAFPDYKYPFVIYTDASALRFGAVLMQQDPCGKNRAVAYASRTLSQVKSKYSVTHQETLSVV